MTNSMRLLGQSLLLLSILLASPALWAVDIKIAGSAKRGSSVSSVTIAVELRNVLATDVAAGDLRKRLSDGLKLFLANHAESELPLAYSSQSTVGRLPVYSVSFLSEPQSERQVDGPNYTINASFRIDDNGASQGFDELMASNNQKIRINAKYYDLTLKEDKIATPAELGKDSYVANDAPTGLKSTPTHHGIQISWDARTSIKYNDKEGSQKAPSGVNLIFIDTSKVSSFTFAGKTFKEKAEDEVDDSTCEFTATEAGCTISQCTDGKTSAYIDLGDIETEGISVHALAGDATSYTVNNLDPENTFAAFAQYEPSGLQLSKCIVAKPTQNFSVTELNGGPDARATDPRCFIATAAFGTPLGAELNTLRWFRDTMLMTHGLGRRFVKFYYRTSPPLADYIASHKPARYATLAILWPVVQYLKLLKGQAVLTLLGTALLFGFGLVWRMRSRV